MDEAKIDVYVNKDDEIYVKLDDIIKSLESDIISGTDMFNLRDYLSFKIRGWRDFINETNVRRKK